MRWQLESETDATGANICANLGSLRERPMKAGNFGHRDRYGRGQNPKGLVRRCARGWNLNILSLRARCAAHPTMRDRGQVHLMDVNTEDLKAVADLLDAQLIPLGDAREAHEMLERSAAAAGRQSRLNAPGDS